MEKTDMTIVPEEEIGFMDVEETNFSAFSLGEKIRHFEVEGYVVLPNVISRQKVNQLRSELADIDMIHKDYSVYQTVSTSPPQWYSPAVAELIANPPVVEFLRELMGPQIVYTLGAFQRTHQGSPGISLHTDGQPYGSSIFTYEGSPPRLLRVLYYLQDLTTDRAPFRLVPRSHLSFHANANPYLRYKSHPEEITLCVKSGSAIVIPKDLFHGTHPNKDREPRELIQFGYRPAWAGPIQEMEEWNQDLVDAAPEEAKPFLRSLNTSGGVWHLENKPKGMKTHARGINPSRWEQE